MNNCIKGINQGGNLQGIEQLHQILDRMQQNTLRIPKELFGKSKRGINNVRPTLHQQPQSR